MLTASSGEDKVQISKSQNAKSYEENNHEPGQQKFCTG
jgi:hypothetical protein